MIDCNCDMKLVELKTDGTKHIYICEVCKEPHYTHIIGNIKRLCSIKNCEQQIYPMNIQSKGLGDDIAKLLEKIGVTKEKVSEILGRPCNCSQRQDWLNKMFPRRH